MRAILHQSENLFFHQVDFSSGFSSLFIAAPLFQLFLEEFKLYLTGRYFLTIMSIFYTRSLAFREFYLFRYLAPAELRRALWINLDPKKKKPTAFKGSGLAETEMKKLVSLLRFLYPGHLDRFQDLFIRPRRLVIEVIELADPAMQVSEAHGQRIDFRVLLEELFGNAYGVGPLHGRLLA